LSLLGNAEKKKFEIFNFPLNSLTLSLVIKYEFIRAHEKMGRRSWFHKIYCKNDYDKLVEFFESGDRIFIVGFAVLNGKVFLHKMLGGFCDEEGKKTLTVLTSSDGILVIEKMTSKEVIEDWNAIILLDNISP